MEKFFHQPDPSESFGLCFSRFDCNDPGGAGNTKYIWKHMIYPHWPWRPAHDHFQKRVYDTGRLATAGGLPCVLTGDSADMVRQPAGYILELLMLLQLLYSMQLLIVAILPCLKLSTARSNYRQDPLQE